MSLLMSINLISIFKDIYYTFISQWCTLLCLSSTVWETNRKGERGLIETPTIIIRQLVCCVVVYCLVSEDQNLQTNNEYQISFISSALQGNVLYFLLCISAIQRAVTSLEGSDVVSNSYQLQSQLNIRTSTRRETRMSCEKWTVLLPNFTA